MALRVLLTVLGLTFTAASRWSEAFRRQLSRDVVIEIRSDDGVAHQFVFRERRARSAPGRAYVPAAASCSCCARGGPAPAAKQSAGQTSSALPG